jgi:AraC-like DNA-binding protein
MRAVLDGLRLTGAVFLRAEYTENWAYESLPVEDVASALVPDARRVTLFHVVASGRCWVEVDSGERHWASAGDVIVLPYGDSHRMGGLNDAELVSAATFVTPPPWSEMPVIRYGEGGDATDVVCGYLTSDDPLFDPGLRALPPVFVVSPTTPTAQAFVRANIDYALQQTALVGENKVEVSTEVPRLLLTEILRIHLASAPASQSGWLLALRDPILAPALAALHADAGRKWTVAELARSSLVSASSLDQRFRDVLGMPPIRYLTVWRMHTARSLLSSTELSIAAVARRVGYDSEEAFSRAFKRVHGVSPSRWRVATSSAV